MINTCERKKSVLCRALFFMVYYSYLLENVMEGDF